MDGMMGQGYTGFKDCVVPKEVAKESNADFSRTISVEQSTPNLVLSVHLLLSNLKGFAYIGLRTALHQTAN